VTRPTSKQLPVQDNQDELPRCGKPSEQGKEVNALNTGEHDEKVIPTVCSSHCGGACLLRVHVEDGVITRIESDDNGKPPLRGCAKGRAYRQRVYAPDRLRFPMKRVGARGEGRFQRISWDEALDTVASEIRRVNEHYGPSAIMVAVGSGDIVWLHNITLPWTPLNRLGGFTQVWGTFSFEGGLFAEFVTYGTTYTRSTRDDLLNSRLIIMWGWNPAHTIQDTGTNWLLVEAKERGVKIVSVDPRLTDTAAAFANQWIPIRPGTDAAMLIAMAFVIISENLQDQSFLDTYTTGFDRFREYVLGMEDNIPKTPSWAEAITGVPASTIEQLAREYATAKPAALIAGIGPGRTAYGEQYHRAAMTLTAMTGNIGIHGGDAAGRSFAAGGSFPFLTAGLGILPTPNPLLSGLPRRKFAPKAYYEDPLWGILSSTGHVNRHKMADMILKGKAGGYPSDVKLLYVTNANPVNQYLNTNKMVEALMALEFIVINEQFMTATAKYADILLPTNTFLERNDMTTGEGVPFYGYQNKVIDSLHESKSPLEIAIELANHLGMPDFCDQTEDALLRRIVAGTEITDYDAFKNEAIHRVKLSEPYVALKKQIEDPADNPFPTPSGKIEIFSQEIAEWNNPQIPPIPKYIETWESKNDPLAEKYPLQLITPKAKLRSHTQYDNVPWLRELEAQTMWINPVDAQARGVKDGDQIMVFNDRGNVAIMAKVTERIIPGAVAISTGAWYNPDEEGVDRGGCCNVLTKDEHSPAGAMCCNTCLVEVRKV
jgi:anaerobic dimethyl sulfoxide reductase subunit A